MLMRLDNNRQLYDYLVAIGAKLNSRGAVDLSRAVLTASRKVATIPDTEFLGESRIALRRVANEQTVLTEDERLELLDIVGRLDEAFSRR
jgi:hypothetical protein